MLFTDTTDWYTARKRCQGLGGDLVAFGQRRDMDRLVDWIFPLKVINPIIWIGLTTTKFAYVKNSYHVVSRDHADWFWLSSGTTPAVDAWARTFDANGDVYTFPGPPGEECVALTFVDKTWKNSLCGPDPPWLQLALPNPFVCDIPY